MIRTALSALAIVLFVGCTEASLTVAPSVVEVVIAQPGTTIGTGNGSEPGQPVMTLDPPLLEGSIGDTLHSTVNLTQAGQPITPKNITVGGLNPAVATLTTDTDQRTLAFLCVGAGITAPIITASGFQQALPIICS